MKNEDPKLASSGTKAEDSAPSASSVAEFDVMFKALEPVEPRAEFLRTLRQIPLQHPRRQRTGFEFFGLRFALGLAASLGLGVLAGTFPISSSDESSELALFMDLDAQDQPLDLAYFDTGAE